MPPAVFFGDGRRPEASTRVNLPAFDGPLGLLLALIETQKLDVLTVPLGVLAGAYVEALATLEGDRIGNVSAFVAVASQLILIKSRAMLPRRAPDAPGEPLLDEGADPEAELRARLILYRAFRDGGLRLQEAALLRFGLFRREPTAAQAAALAGSRPPSAPPLDPASLAETLRALVRIVPPPPTPPEALARTITIAQRTEVIRAALRGAGSIVLQDLLRGVRDRVVVTVTFLALLELAKQREIELEQAEPWGPIVARSVGRSTETAS
jgi:segregation and condensation protein A